MLELRALRVTYGRVEVVHGVDLDVGEGEAVGLVGPNGAGKSSILAAICGLHPPSGGSVLFESRSLRRSAPEQIARFGISMVPEGRQIFRTLSVEENLALGARNGDRGRGEDVLRRFPILRERARQRADRLSGGEQQQLALARALVGEPKLLILDEPSLGLAPKMIDAIYAVLEELREEGMPMLLVEQNVTRTIEFCDRCAVLRSGEIQAEGTRKELARSRVVLNAYLGGEL